MNCCSTGMDFNYPDYLAMGTEDLQEINSRKFSQVVDSAKKLPVNDKNSIQIAVYTDIIDSKIMQQLLFIMKHKDFYNFDIRKVTEEEKVVLGCKLQNKPYDFYNVDWKSRFSGTLFPPPPPSHDSDSKY